jgi:hypothetical protein
MALSQWMRERKRNNPSKFLMFEHFLAEQENGQY